MVTLKQVADLAGVSTATVSRVVSGKQVVASELKEKVQRIIDETGYLPNDNARALANKHADMLGLVTPDLSLSFFGTLAAGVIEASDALGIRVNISNSGRGHESDLEAVSAFHRQGYKSIVIDNLHCDEHKLIQLSRSIPGLVLINRFIPSIANRCVCVDNTTGGLIAAQHLIENGHSQIAFITSNSEIQDPLDRIYGAKHAFQQSSIGFSESLIVKYPPNIEGGKAAISELLDSGQRFTSVVAYNDNMAIGAMNELIDRGIDVPNDISIIGFDNLFFSETCRPSLTTLNYPIREMAAYAVTLSLELAKNDGSSSNKSHRFIPNLVTRHSVKAINGAD